MQSVLLEDLAGYEPLRAAGERGVGTSDDAAVPLVLARCFVPALGGAGLRA